MSYDIWLESGAEDADMDCPGNYTYNVDPMFALALDGDAEQGVQNGGEVVFHRKDPALRRFVGERAGDCYVALCDAVEHMEDHPTTYRALNPENGWGDYEGALTYLRDFRDACLRFPDARVEAWL